MLVLFIFEKKVAQKFAWNKKCVYLCSVKRNNGGC